MSALFKATLNIIKCAALQIISGVVAATGHDGVQKRSATALDYYTYRPGHGPHTGVVIPLKLMKLHYIFLFVTAFSTSCTLKWH